MRSSSREVNIFNMSLLDILCGALGAFCFLTLVLFPSYQNAAAAGGSAAALEEELKKTRAELERAREQAAAGATGDVKQMTEQLKQAESAWHEAEARARDSDSKLRQARAEFKKAQEENEKNAMRARMAKTPMVVTAMWSPPDAEVNMYVRFADKQPDGKVAAPFNPNVHQDGAYAGENWFSWTGHEQWLIRDVPDGNYEVYYRVAKRGDARQPLQVSARYAMEGVVGTIPSVTFDATRNSAFVGTLVRNGPKLEFRPGGGQK